MVHQTFPLKERFNKILHNIRESGLMEKWRSNDMYKVELKTLMRYRDLEMHSEGNLYKMDEMWFIFLTYFICCMVACFIFVLEILANKLWNIK